MRVLLFTTITLSLLGIFSLHSTARAAEYIYPPDHVAALNDPWGMTASTSGAFYIASTDKIFKIGADGEVALTFGSHGCGDGEFTEIHGLTSDSAGNVYAADYGCGQVSKFDGDGNFLLRFSAGFIMGVAVDNDGNIYTSGQEYTSINKYDASGSLVDHINPTGEPVSTWAYGLTSDSAGDIYIADCGNFRVKKMDAAGNLLLAFGSEGTGDGQFKYPCGIAVDASGNIYVADVGGNYRVQKFDPSGNFLMKFGSYGASRGQFTWSPGIMVDSAGYIYVADRSNNRVEKFNPSGEFVTQWNPTGSPADLDIVDNGATLTLPASSSFYANNLYVALGGTLSLGSNTGLSLNALITDIGATLLHASGAQISTSAGWVKQKTLFSEQGPWGLGLATGLDGFPRIAWINYDAQTLNFVRCTDADCSASVSTEVANDYGQYDYPGSSILTLGSDGFARMVYMNTDGNIIFVRCLDADCTTKNTNLITSTNDSNIGYYGAAIVMGDDDLPRIEYEGGGTGDVHFVRCSDADCAAPIDTVVATNGGYSYIETGFAIGPDHFARILYESGDSPYDINLVRCTDSDCGSPVITSVTQGVGNYPGFKGKVIKIGSDGFPRITYVDYTNALAYIVCADEDCTDKTITQLPDTSGGSGDSNFGMDLRSGDLASITYEDTSGHAHLLNCTNSSCSTYTDILLSSIAHGIYGGAPLIIGPDDLPRLLYSDYYTTLSYARLTSSAGPLFTNEVTPAPTPVRRRSTTAVLTPSQVAQVFSLGTTPVATPTTATPPTVSTTITKYLVLGSRNDEVFALQKLLNSLGFRIAVTGPGSSGNETSYFGALTRAAVIKYQLAHGITPTGTVGPITRAALASGK